ncbi:MAG: LOG family protein [Leptospiraceae bacterium]|nr:LOG family protein [Leptospiraceae bacterium]
MSELEPANLDPPEIPLALENQDFIKDPDARPLRILSEYFHPLKVFREQNITDTVVFFGSARTLSSVDPRLRQGMSLFPMARYHDDARVLARQIAEWSRDTIFPATGRHIHICTGGGPGIMEAANKGAHEAAADNIGLNIVLPHEQHPNAYITPRLNFNFQYFFMRKYWFLYYARVLLAFPGGFGTLDELFETLTLRQTGIVDSDFKLLLYGKQYWNQLVNFQLLADSGMIDPNDLELFTIVDSVAEAMHLIQIALKRLLDA